MSRNALLAARWPRLILLSLAAALLALSAPRAAAQAPLSASSQPPRSARVVIVHAPDATYRLVPVPDRIRPMMDRALTTLTGKSTVSNAWRSLVSTQDTVGIKVFSAPGSNSGTRPAVVAAVVQDLLAAGLPPRRIIVWDQRAVDLRLAGFYEFEERFGIRVAGAVDAGYDPKTFYDTPLLGTLLASDLEFGNQDPAAGRKSHVSKLLTGEITKIINITPLMHHNFAGVSGNLYTLAIGGVDNTWRFENNADHLARAVPEIYALPILGDRVALNIVDALICQYEGQQRGLLHYSTVLNEIRVSRDPVALDVLSLDEIKRQRRLSEDLLPANTNLDLYSNASLLEIGISDPARIQVDRVEVSPPPSSGRNSAPTP